MERTRIFLCGRKGGPVSSRRVKEVLGRYLPNCLVEEGEGWPPDRQGPGLLLFRSGFCRPVEAALLPGWVALLPAGCAEGLRALQGTGIPTVTCGASSRDTLSISSWDFPQGAVSVLRGVTTLAGEPVEPGEIPVKMAAPLEPEGMLALCGALILCGVPPEEGYLL